MGKNEDFISACMRIMFVTQSNKQGERGRETGVGVGLGGGGGGGRLRVLTESGTLHALCTKWI